MPPATAPESPRRWSQPPLATSQPRNPLALIRERARQHPHHIAFHLPHPAGDIQLTLGDFLTHVERVASALLNLGLQRGEAVCLLAATSYGWAVVEWATWRAGGVVVPIYETSPASTVAQIAQDTNARILFADAAAMARTQQVGSEVRIVQLGERDDVVRDFGRQPTHAKLAQLQAREPDRDDLATIVFTSGTSGHPQGTRILHRNFVDLVLNVQAAWQDVLHDQGRTVIFLPLAHVLARGLQTICMWAGMRITYLAQPAELILQLPQLKPTFLVVVPRVLEKIENAAATAAAAKRLGRFSLALVWRDATRTAIAWGQYQEDLDAGLQPSVSRLLRCKHGLYDKLFYRRLRAMLGGHIEFLLSGGARLGPRLSLLFRGMAIPVMEGYGLTETTAPLAGNRPGRVRSGTVGELVPGTQVRIAPDGVVWVRGVGVSPGYLDPTQTAAMHVDGWFNTGDLGTLSTDGYLTITGRSKDTIVTSGGKTIHPQAWEAQVEADPRIEHAVVIGEGRPYLVAVAVLAPDSATPPGHARVVTEPEVRQAVAQVVAQANETVSRAESVRRFLVVSADLSAEGGLTTPTQKLRRQALLARFSTELRDLYSSLTAEGQL